MSPAKKFFTYPKIYDNFFKNSFWISVFEKGYNVTIKTLANELVTVSGINVSEVLEDFRKIIATSQPPIQTPSEIIDSDRSLAISTCPEAVQTKLKEVAYVSDEVWDNLLLLVRKVHASPPLENSVVTVNCSVKDSVVVENLPPDNMTEAAVMEESIVIVDDQLDDSVVVIENPQMDSLATVTKDFLPSHTVVKINAVENVTSSNLFASNYISVITISDDEHDNENIVMLPPQHVSSGLLNNFNTYRTAELNGLGAPKKRPVQQPKFHKTSKRLKYQYMTPSGQIKTVHHNSSTTLPHVIRNEKSSGTNRIQETANVLPQCMTSSGQVNTHHNSSLTLPDVIPIAETSGAIRAQSVLPQVNDPGVVPLKRLRPIIIDGSNVAIEQHNGIKEFSWKKIKICVDYFVKKGHNDITVFLPRFRQGIPGSERDYLEKKGFLTYTPSRKLPNGKLIACYDDRFIVDLATQKQGIILSNDNYRDIINEKPEWKETISKRLLMYCFVGDILMIPEDPYGRLGPSLEAFLTHDQ